MKLYICLLTISFTISTHTGALGSVYGGSHGPNFGPGFVNGQADGFGVNGFSGPGFGLNGGPGELGHLHGPIRVLKVQELNKFHGYPQGQPLLLKVFYKRGHEAHHNGVAPFNDPGHGNGPHKVINIVHEGDIPHNFSPNVIKVVHENDPHHHHHHHGPVAPSEVVKVVHEHHHATPVVPAAPYAPNFAVNSVGILPAKVIKVLDAGVPLPVYANGFTGALPAGLAKAK